MDKEKAEIPAAETMMVVHGCPFQEVPMLMRRRMMLNTPLTNEKAIMQTALSKFCNEYLFTVTGVKKVKWFLSLIRSHFQSRVTEGHEWLGTGSSE